MPVARLAQVGATRSLGASARLRLWQPPALAMRALAASRRLLAPARRLFAPNACAWAAASSRRPHGPLVASARRGFFWGSSAKDEEEEEEAEMERLRERLRAVHSLIEDVIERRVQLKQEMSQAASRHQGDLENEDRYGIAKFAKARV